MQLLGHLLHLFYPNIKGKFEPLSIIVGIFEILHSFRT